jgi:predicted peroxiredoxin
MMRRRLAVLLWAANPDSPHLCATPFFSAAAAAAMDAEVEVYFTGKSVCLLAHGVAESLPTGPRERRTVYDFMRHAAEHGAKFYACSHAMLEYGVAPTDFIAEATGVAGAASYVERSLDDTWVTLVY